MLYEYGHVFPIGLCQLQRIAAVVEDPDCDLPALVIAECQDLLARIAEKTESIEARTKALKALAAETATARRPQTMPGAGLLTALAVEAFAPDMAQFRSGRDLFAGETLRCSVSFPRSPWLGWCHASTRPAARRGRAGSPRRARAKSGGC